MKPIFYLIMALVLAAKTEADPNRYEWRSFGGVNVELQPLFSWWTFASQAAIERLDITEVDSNKLAMISNIWTHLPARPLPGWLRIRGREDGITVVGSMWKVDATIEPAPMMAKHEMIYLRNPPVKEIQDYKQARAAYAALQNAQNNDVASEQYMKSNIQAEADAMRQTNSTSPAAPVTPTVASQAQNLERNSVMTISNLNSAHARTQYRDDQLAPVMKYLSTFPDTNVYWVDHFALRTGEEINGLEVYDLGVAEGLTY
jgi:hypothetical protein